MSFERDDKGRLIVVRTKVHCEDHEGTPVPTELLLVMPEDTPTQAWVYVNSGAMPDGDPEWYYEGYGALDAALYGMRAATLAIITGTEAAR